MGVEAGIAVAGQVQVTLHHQVAVLGFTDDFHPGAQVEGIGVGGVVQAGEFVIQQVLIEQRRIDKGFAQGVFLVQVALGDFLVRPAAGGRVGFFRRIVIARHAVEGDGARALDG